MYVVGIIVETRCVLKRASRNAHPFPHDRNSIEELRGVDDLDGIATQSPFAFKLGATDMGDKGSKDKGKREQQKKAQLTPKEKRRLKKEKKNK